MTRSGLTASMRSSRRHCIALVALTFTAACGGSGSGGGSVTSADNVLSSFQSCEALHEAVLADARQRIRVQADNLRASALDFGPVPSPTPDFFFPSGPSATPAPGGLPDTPEDFTQTNVQVRDVDEADVVETDGTQLYLLTDTSLLILDSWPPEATALRTEVAIEGLTTSMFVDGDRALVLSSVDDPSDASSPCHALGPPIPELDIATPCFATTTKLSLIDLANDPPTVEREVYLEGNVLSARRHGDIARVIVRRDWGLPRTIPGAWSAVYAPYPTSHEEIEERISDWERDALAAVDATALDDWLPTTHERRDGTLKRVEPNCATVHVPAAGHADDGSTHIATLDLRDPSSTIEETTIVGRSTTAFASLETLLLAQPDWSWDWRSGSTNRTAVHVFDLAADPPSTVYRASGYVAGTPLSQFAFGTDGDVIHMASTVARFDVTTNRITSFRVDGTSLTEVGVTPDLAPGERIFAVRYLGTTAYVVTFRQIDPLFVIDLADPTAPKVLGEVELPGFSEYIHPLGEHHLLTIGQDGNMFGQLSGMALRIFDVTDPTDPRLTHVETLGGRGWSSAQANHLVFTFDASRGLLALPYSRFDGGYVSSLVLLGVDAASGFDVRGEVDHTFFGTPCASQHSCVAPASVERGLFIEDWLYSISSRGVLVNAVADLSPVATVPFP